MTLLVIDDPSEAVPQGKRFVPSGLLGSTWQHSSTGQSRDRITDVAASSSDEICQSHVSLHDPSGIGSRDV